MAHFVISGCELVDLSQMPQRQPAAVTQGDDYTLPWICTIAICAVLSLLFFRQLVYQLALTAFAQAGTTSSLRN